MAENQVQNPPAEKVIALSASLLEPFQGHPFRVASGEEMEQPMLIDYRNRANRKPTYKVSIIA